MGKDSLYALHVGIDVSGDFLDVCTSAGEFWRCGNDPTGIASLVQRLRPHSVDCIFLAATTGDVATVAAALHAAGLPVTTATAAQLRHFAHPRGYLRDGAAFNAATLMRIARAISPPHRGPLIHVY
jgi:transposase